MIEFTQGQMEAIAADARAGLRASILTRWFERLREEGDAVGQDGRAAILAEIDEMARDPAIPVADLMMLADLKLVELATGAHLS